LAVLAAPGSAVYARAMAGVTACDVPEGSLLAGIGVGSDYRGFRSIRIGNRDKPARRLSVAFPFASA
jgi:hypothetical protein